MSRVIDIIVKAVVLASIIAILFHIISDNPRDKTDIINREVAKMVNEQVKMGVYDMSPERKAKSKIHSVLHADEISPPL